MRRTALRHAQGERTEGLDRYAVVAWILSLLLLVPNPVFAETPWTLVKSYPHDTRAFTEGLFWLDGSLYESTGQPGQSDIRQVRLKDGKVVRRTAIETKYFGEGIVPWNGRLISLTWQHRTGFIWTLHDFKRVGSFSYRGEGWALTSDGKRLIMSDGTPQLRFLGPETLQEIGHVTVTDNGRPVRNLNELEYVDGEVLANVWMTNRIARIDPESGAVKDWIDLGPLAATMPKGDPDAVLNGIAWDGAKRRLFVTGKYWPKLFEIRLEK